MVSLRGKSKILRRPKPRESKRNGGKRSIRLPKQRISQFRRWKSASKRKKLRSKLRKRSLRQRKQKGKDKLRLSLKSANKKSAKNVKR